MGLTALDTGVLIAVLNSLDAHHDGAVRAMAAARDRGDRLIIPASAYAELLVGPLRSSGEDARIVDDFLDALPAPVEPATRDIARQAAELRARHGSRLRLPDALVVATAIVLHADRILTTDAGWPDIGLPVEVVSATSARSDSTPPSSTRSRGRRGTT